MATSSHDSPGAGPPPLVPAETLEQFHASEFARVRAEFEATGDGRAAVRERTKLVNRVVLRLWEEHFGVRDTQDMALVAIGGFGRGELFPCSDIDLLFLCRDLPDDSRKQKIGALCRELWDLRLRVSPTTRTPDFCDKLDVNNVEGALALLDCRRLAGDPELFSSLHDNILPRMVRREWQALMQGVVSVTGDRHKKYGSTVFHLEPNVKDSPGGLRDQHISLWLALIQALDKRRSWPAPDSLVPESSRTQFQEACEFLYAVRCFLHYRQGRDDNKLYWEAQDEAAVRGIGIERGAALDAAEWMRVYYRHARAIYRLATQVLDDIAPARSSLFQQFQQWRSRISNADFTVVGGRVFLQQSSAIRQPDMMLRLFSFIARHGLKLSADTERRAAQALPEVAPRLPQGPALWAHLREILTGPEAAQALRAMQGLGLLNQLIPEFKLIDSLVVRDFYHRYTVDEHSFLTIENLHRLDRAEGTWEKQFSELLSEVEQPDLLYLSLLLHDLGKSREGRHVAASLEIAEGVLERLQLRSQDRDTVRFLIANHLEMSLAMRRDIFDPDNVRSLAAKAGTPERLRLLCLLTYADIRSVNPESLTPWKAQGLWQLYIAAAKHLSRSADEEQTPVHEEAARALAIFPDRADEIRAFLNGFPHRYLKTYAEQAAYHFQLASQLRANAVQLALDANHDLFELTVITADRPRLFSTIVGVLFAWGMDIVKANAFSNEAGVIVDTFLFRDRFRTLVLNPLERERFKRSLTDILTGRADLDQLVQSRMSSEKSGSAKVRIETRIEFDSDCSPHSTLLELLAQDRPGLLYTISSALASERCNIDVALIDTEGQMAIDVFYLTSAGRKLTRAHQQRVAQRLREELQIQ